MARNKVISIDDDEFIPQKKTANPEEDEDWDDWEGWDDEWDDDYLDDEEDW